MRLWHCQLPAVRGVCWGRKVIWVSQVSQSSLFLRVAHAITCPGWVKLISYTKMFMCISESVIRGMRHFCWVLVGFFFKSHFVFFVHLNTKQKSVFTAAIKTEKFTPKPSGWINGAIGQRKTTSIFNDWIKSVFDIGEYFFKWVELIAVQIFYGRSNYSWRNEQEIKVISALLQITKKENK